jgi:hypothetical protein
MYDPEDESSVGTQYSSSRDIIGAYSSGTQYFGSYGQILSGRARKVKGASKVVSTWAIETYWSHLAFLLGSEGPSHT